MKTLNILTARNSKLFFKDKGLFFSSMITPIILLVLYVTFLANVYKDSFTMSMPQGFSVPEKLIDATVGAQLLSSLLAVCCITIAFCSNIIMIQDKFLGSYRDLTVSPVKSSVLSLSYYISTALNTMIVCYAACGIAFIYLAFKGWYFTAADILYILFDVFLLVMFGTALSSIINSFLSTQGQASAVGTIVSAGYGFICGAYMPMSQFSEGLRNTLALLPGTYGTSLIRNHTLAGVFREMDSLGFPAEVIDGIRDSIDCNIYLFGNKVQTNASFAVLLCTVAVLIAMFVLLNFIRQKRAGK